jgi:2-polyprenyl-3-methyl-5-hydroxy-6-metoxy-1,4-benzoquinol methylase
MQIKHLSNPIKYEFEDLWLAESSSDNFWIRWRFSFFEKNISKIEKDIIKKNLLVLDVGCGLNNFAKNCSEISNWTIDGADIDIKSLTSASAANGTLFFYDINDRKDEMKGKYDIIFLMDVLEHVEDYNFFMESILFHLRNGGLLLCNVPAFPSLFSSYDYAVGHRRRYSKNTLIEVLKFHNFQILFLSYWGMLLLPFLFLRRIQLGKSVPKKEQLNSIITRGWHAPKFIKKILEIIMYLEIKLWNRCIAGTSLMCIAKKK